MTCRIFAGAACASRRRLQRITLLSLAGWLALASGGCFLRSKPKPPPPPTQQQLAAYAANQTALRNGVSNPNGEAQAHCDQLAAAAPGVEELRTNNGIVESRQWKIVANGSAAGWTVVRVQGGSTDAWGPKPGIDKLGFQPPIEPALGASAGSSLFLAYAPTDSTSVDDYRKSAAVKDDFGPAQGQFVWRGKRYSYTLTRVLPCFPSLQ
jgi:hypothetical protein